jgi:2-polyprenyl-6-methoxyphenol hydroxylase-like FAD-dependent oxidoreductase
MSIAPPHGELLEIPTFSASGHVTVLPNERVATALGDAHSVVDPVVGQGANSASYSAWELGTVIGEDPNVDERFAPKGAARRANRVRVGHPGNPRAHERVPRASRNVAVRQADDPGTELTRVTLTLICRPPTRPGSTPGERC